jgi:GTP cyclohydrolase FolE2
VPRWGWDEKHVAEGRRRRRRIVRDVVRGMAMGRRLLLWLFR